MYRSFRPLGKVTAAKLFVAQLGIVKMQLTIVVGDFNLDALMEMRSDNSYKDYYDKLLSVTPSTNLVQLLDFTTWTRTINGVNKGPFWTRFIQIMSQK